ncbi:UvrD-helicase domain-containing protein [Salinibacterium sp. SYSU T00001]|uniref:nuclease-related domain-containing DEAD/DEAH box helicase n=1 Tax=Homoserinimonas sedimenticola TaxID=2986805 RepID=UPI0022369525|nr:UvrD-helicase domain-containing protein [Salinibacterium sedimenticola]MCW4386318.1 UvrD-helicase domain-containing protein [Salinibacterium sedimenticola]
MSALSASFESEAASARAEAARYAAAAIAERKLAHRLAPLLAHGYHLLADRKWPGSKSAQLDLIVVGPSGVWIVDSKHWNDFTIAGGSMFRGDADVTDDVLRLADVANDAESAFAEVGLAPGEVRSVLAMHGHSKQIGEVGPVEVVGADDIHRHFAKRGNRLSIGEVERVLAVAIQYFPAYVGPQIESIPTVIAEPAVDELVDEISDELFEDGALLTEAEVLEALTLAQLAEEIEGWMTFLHPSQAKLVRRTFNGPARIRGSAGTGKTVVGLHRAAYLARMHPEGKVLFTTFVKTLPAVMANLLKRLDPSVVERVEFVSVHKWALDVLRQRGIRHNLSGREASKVWNTTWKSLPAEHTERLAARAGSRDDEYWREEVDSVIKGRGFTTFEAYAECARPGRSIRLNMDDRRAVWALYRAYEDGLRAAGIHDFNDIILLAERSLQQQPLEGYSAVIVDEAQDLSLAMIRMLHSLVGDATDAFTLIGDGQQSIYPGGYVLSEAGISLAGRGVVLSVNYRNTVAILDFANRTIAATGYVDIDDTAAPAPDAATDDSPELAGLRREGTPPIFDHFATPAEHDAALVRRVRQAAAHEGYSLGDIAVLCDTNWQVKKVMAMVKAADLDCINLEDYDGTTVHKVKVGTIKRAKGLEFKAVLLPWTPRLPDTVNPDDERMSRAYRERYVAATRARDRLWLGSC